MQLSERLKRVIEFVPPCDTVADIGTDHGYVPITLVQKGVAKKAYALDINKGPLERAKEHIFKEGLSEKIILRQSDGLAKLGFREADIIVITGMGGELMVRILSEGEKVLEGVDALILSPQSEIFLVREYLCKHGFMIEKEDMLEDMGKFYTIMRAVRIMDKNALEVREEKYDKLELLYGRNLLSTAHPVLKKYLSARFQTLQNIKKELTGQESEAVKIRFREIEGEMEGIRQALEKMNKDGSGQAEKEV